MDSEGTEIGRTGARFGGARRRPGKGVPATVAPQPADVGQEIVGQEVAERDGPGPSPVGLTGARFGGAPRRRRGATPPAIRRPAAPSPPVDAVAPGPDAGIAYDGLRTAPIPVPTPVEPMRVEAAAPAAFDPSQPSSVRPYVLTGGRTRAQFDLAVETLLSATPTGTGPAFGDHRDIVELCREPRSVAEIAALRGIPLGVARVLLGDLALAGAVSVHRTAGPEGPDLALMERVLTGLRRL